MARLCRDLCSPRARPFYPSAPLFFMGKCSVYQLLGLALSFPSGFLSFPVCEENLIALYNSSSIYLASTFGNGPQVNEKESSFSVDTQSFHMLFFYYSTSLRCTASE